MKTLFILATGRSGSAFLHSLFDAHPQVLTYPAIHSVYSPFFRTATLETIDDVVEYVAILTRLHIHFRNAYDEAIGKIGPANDENFFVDADRFLPLLRQELSEMGAPFVRRVIVTAIHRAYSRYLGREPDEMRLMVEHVHNPSELANALADFPDAYCIHTLRDPCPAYYGMIDLSMKAYGHFKSEFFFKFTKNVFLMPWKNIGFAHLPFAPNRYRVVHLEKLNASGEAIMRDIASWLGIDYDETLSRSTVGGRICHGNSGSVKSVTGFTGSAQNPSPRPLGRIDVLRIETLLRGPMRAQGYEPKTPDTLWTRTLGLLSFFVPLRRELRVNPVAIYRDVRVDNANFPLGRIVMFALRQKHPALHRVLARFGLADPVRFTHRGLAGVLVLALTTKRTLLDPWLYYLERVALFIRCFVGKNAPWP